MPAGSVDQLMRERLERLQAIERPSASEGERDAAEWLRSELASLGVEVRIEEEPAHGTYWWPLGLGTSLGIVASALGLESDTRRGRTAGRKRLRRVLGTALGALGALGIASDFPPNRRILRRILPRRRTHNVVADLGPAEADRTVVFVAHHDAAHGGLVFHPSLPHLADRLGLIEKSNTSPPLMAPVVGGPALGAAGALLGSKWLSRSGLALSLGSTAAMLDIGARRTVPGANDNGTGVLALIALAERLSVELPARTRVILLSTGSEESFSEGIEAFGRRHFPSLPRETTMFCSLDTLGSPHLCVLRGEGFLRMREYTRDALDLIDSLAEELGVYLYPGLRLRNGTDGLAPLCAGYPTISMCSCTDLKQPANYHSFNDVAGNVDYETVAESIRLCEALVRRLDEGGDFPSAS